MDAYRTINDTLVNLFNEIWELEKEAIITEEFKELEEKAIITDEFSDISNNDMHIIEAIGLSGENTMSSVAKKLKITAGSLTTAVNALVRKAYVKRERSEEDRRVVYIALTEKGEKAFYHHEQFHRQMTNAVIEKLDDEEIDALVKMLKDISAFFRSYQS